MNNMELTFQQNKVFEQIKAFLNSDASVFILRGYAGTGKTTMVKVVADYISQSRQLIMMAPTGRAARVLSDKTGYRATTIHRAIYEKAHLLPKRVKDVAESEFKFVFPIHKSDKEGDIVAIVDEASMVCSRKIEHELFIFGTDNLMDDLLTYVRPNFGGKVIFVGDPAQLPPVGESVSSALSTKYFQGKGLEVVEAELTEVLRQKGDSIILKNAMMIRDLLNKDKRNQLVFEEQKMMWKLFRQNNSLINILITERYPRNMIVLSSAILTNLQVDIIEIFVRLFIVKMCLLE